MPEHAEIMDDVCGLLVADAADGGRAHKVWPGMLNQAYPELKGLSLDVMMVRFVLRSLQHRNAGVGSDFREFCAGRGNLTFQLLRKGLKGFAFDKAYSSSHDMCTKIGLRLWLDAISDSRPGSLDWFGTKCSPFVGINKRNSKRYIENGWMGDESREFVRHGNLQMLVTSLAFALSCLCKNHVVLEQPVTSCMPLCQPLAMLIKHFKCQRVITWHGAFDKESPKCLQSITTLGDIKRARRARPKDCKKKIYKKTKNGKFNGIKKQLSGSQVYSVEFAKCIANIVAQQ